MTNLLQQLKSKLAFDEDAQREYLRDIYAIVTPPELATWSVAAQHENARLTPLHEALCEIVIALEAMTKYGANDVTIATSEICLRKLTKALEGMR